MSMEYKCNSLNGFCEPPTDYCPKCSHGYRLGEGVDKNGKTWKFEMWNQFGPQFLRKDGVPLKNQPGEDSPAWDVFEEWEKNNDSADKP